MARLLSERYLSLKERRPNIDLTQVLQVLCTEVGLDNLSYLGFHGGPLGTAPIAYSTYDPAWAQRYEAQRYHLIDPVVDRSLCAALPMDWTEVPRYDRATRNFFGEAAEFGVQPNGISIPIRDHTNGKAVLTLNSGMRVHEWRKYKMEIIADAIYLGCLIHADLISSARDASCRAVLSRREKEVLKWAAVGKTAWETAQIMKVSNSTVNHHLYNACEKLNVANKTHAVAKALTGQLIAV